MKTEPRHLDTPKTAIVLIRMEPRERDRLAKLAFRRRMSLARFLRARLAEVDRDAPSAREAML